MTPAAALSQFDQVNHSRFDGSSSYHSAQFMRGKAISQRLHDPGHYTLSKYMQATETLQSDDPEPVRVISDP